MRHSAGLTLEPQASPSSAKRQTEPVWGNKSSHVSPVWPCWVLGFGVMWCCAVMFPAEGLDLLTACLQTEGGRYLLQQFHHSIHFIHYSYPFPLLGKQLSTSGSIPGFIMLKRPFVGGLAVWLLFPSFLCLFGIVHLAPTGRPEAAIENISVGKPAPLSRILPNLHHMEGVTQVLKTLKCKEKKNGTQKRES